MRTGEERRTQNRKTSRAMRQRTLRRGPGYLPQSTRVLGAKYSSTWSKVQARKQVEQHLGKKEKTKYRWHTRKAFLTLNDDVKRDIIKDE